MTEILKRLFFGFDVTCPWPATFPSGKIIAEKNRHLTVAFLGKTEVPPLLLALKDMRFEGSELGFAGIFDEPIFLPKNTNKLVAWHAYLVRDKAFRTFKKSVTQWLKEHFKYEEEKRKEILHVSMAREPADRFDWIETFSELPFVMKTLHLFESQENSQYTSIWKHPLLSPFEEIEHTADLAFHILGENFTDLFTHAQIALAFHYPEITHFISGPKAFQNIDSVIIELNKWISHIDTKVGAPYKAISFHDKIDTEKNLLKWEMIVDV